MKRLIPRMIHWLFKRRFQLIYFLGGKVVGARALVLQNDEVLLVQHTYIEGWYTIGGMVDRHETALEAIKRELREEADVHVTEDPELMGIYYTNFDGKDDFIFFYIVKSFTRRENSESMNSLSPEIEECRFFPLNALPEGTSQSTRRRILEYQGKVPIAKEWVPGD